ncbi:MAG: ABC transporter ATP-binding protein [Spirochaetes bacterium]|jgi:ABC-2 type transport system ATP-binding protein|nr:ABC transporter ATP-binding protein [Spirochaetota bacterium]
MISVNGLSKHYGDVVAVNNISFSIRKGEITGLLGPNGAGKTTTLRMLTCYLKPTAGTVTVGDFSAEENPMGVRSIIGYLPESAPIYGDMIVYDYLKYIADIRGITNQARIKEIAEVCGIGDVMHKNVSELSKGYNQRVGLAHAMISDPEILILDEPTSGLDPNQIVEIRNLIKKIGKEKTVILSTHILPEVEATCDRVIIIDKGNIVADGRTSELTSSSGKAVSITLKVSGVDFDTLSNELKKTGWVNSVSRGAVEENLTSAVIVSTASADARPEIFKIVKEKGWVLFEMIRESRSLENVFRELTRGGENG